MSGSCTTVNLLQHFINLIVDYRWLHNGLTMVRNFRFFSRSTLHMLCCTSVLKFLSASTVLTGRPADVSKNPQFPGPVSLRSAH